MATGFTDIHDIKTSRPNAGTTHPKVFETATRHDGEWAGATVNSTDGGIDVD